MKKVLQILLILLLLTISKKEVRAVDNCNLSTSGLGITIPKYPETKTHTIIVNVSSLDKNLSYKLATERSFELVAEAYTPEFYPQEEINESCNNTGCISLHNGQLEWTITEKLVFYNYLNTSKTIKVGLYWGSYFEIDKQCKVGEYEVINTSADNSCSVTLSQERNGKTCYIGGTDSCVETGLDVQASVSGLVKNGELYNGNAFMKLAESPGTAVDRYFDSIINGEGQGTININESALYTINSIEIPFSTFIFNCPSLPFNFRAVGDCEDVCNKNEIPLEEVYSGPDNFSLCKQIPDSQPEQYAKCIECAGGVNGKAGIWTAVGCIKRDPQTIINKFIKIGLGVAGGFALITFLTAGFMYSTSQGSPEQVKKAKEMMTASVMGILFIIFSVTILQYIGWTILKIPGFGG